MWRVNGKQWGSCFRLCLKGFLLSLCLLLAPATHAVEKITYYHNDALGSPVAATDEAGNLLWREEYRPYGDRIRKEAAATPNPRWYTGHPHDNASGLTYMGARWYDPAVGRFLAVDPKDFSESDPLSFNRYNYANNNPYKYIDPDGLEPVGLSFQVGVTAFGKGGFGVAVYFDKKTLELGASWHSESGIGVAGPVPYSAGISLNYIWSTPETKLADVGGMSTQASGSVNSPVLVGIQGGRSIPDSSVKVTLNPSDGGNAGTLNDVDINLGKKRINEVGLSIGVPGAEIGVTRANTRLVTTDIIPRMLGKPLE